MAAVAARTIENASANGELQDVDQARDLAPVADEIEDRSILEEVALVEVRRPPLAQKKTGSR
jgi:hypothetical protein